MTKVAPLLEEIFASEGGITVIGETMKRVSTAASEIPCIKTLNTMPNFTGTADQIINQTMQNMLKNHQILHSGSVKYS